MLRDIHALPDLARPSVGYDVGLDFSVSRGNGQEIWSAIDREISQKFVENSVALVDNTTAVNSMFLLQNGLSKTLFEDAEPAALLPDLMTLIFALTHFDRLLLVDHGNSDIYAAGRIRKLIEWSDSAIQPLRIDASYAGETAYDLSSKFDRIQESFFERTDLHLQWKQIWSALMGAPVADPFPFTISPKATSKKYERLQENLMGALYRTPKHPLQADDDFASALPWMPGGHARYGAFSDFTDAESHAIYASYHTFRAMFYHGLSDFLQRPYVPCAVRQVATHVLPIFEELRPEQASNMSFLRQIDQYRVKETLRFAVPAVQISPTLAVFFRNAIRAKGKSRWISDQHWREAIRSTRDASKRYRRQIRNLLTAFHSGNMEYIEATFSELNSSTPNVLKPVGSAINAAISVHAGDYSSAAKDAWSLLTLKPWEAISRLAKRWHLSFILKARHVAGRSLSLESQCEKIWGRRFTDRERKYLQGVTLLPSD